MTKTNTRSTSHKPQHSGSPRKTQLIKFRVTPEEKRDLEIMCEILHVNMSTLIRRSLLSQPIKQTLVVTGGGEDALKLLHIVISSVRIRTIPRQPYMDKPCDWQEGVKHRCTAAMLRHLRVETMELCQEAGLYQIDLLNGTGERITEKEYWAQRRGQRCLDHANQKAAASGQPIRQTKFETEKAALRRQIRSVLAKAVSLEEFSAQLLQEHGITVRESRGRFSYLTVGRTKPISSRKLGDDFSKENVLAVLAENAERKKTASLRRSDPRPDRISRMIDIQAKLAAGKGAGYEHWAKIFNLKQMAKSLALFTGYNLNSEEELNARVAKLQEKRDEALKVVKDLENRIKANRKLSRHVAAYLQHRKFAQQVKSTKNPETFKEQHRAELTAYQAAAAYFKAQKITKLPSLKQLETEREQLISEKARFYEAYREAKKAWIELSTAQQNLLSILHREDRQQIQEGGLHDTDLRIDPEFKTQIPPLTQDERKQLEENILAEGELLAPILVWNGTIVDGHNRYEILQSHPEIPYSVRNLELKTREEALAWICKHQLGRRNLTPEQKKFLMGKQYDAEKQADGFHGNQHTRPVLSAGAQNEHQQTAEKTCEWIARENHISASAVRRAALFAAGVDLAEELCPGIRQQVLSGDLKAPDALFERLAKARPEKYDALLEQIKNPQSRAKPAAKQKLFQAEKSASSDSPLPPYQGESKPDLEETHSVYSQLADAATVMQERWEIIFKQMPTLLTASEQREAIQAILEKHLAYLASLGFDLSGMTESKGEQSA